MTEHNNRRRFLRRRRDDSGWGGLNMASMPDLIFTVLFFFMIVTHMRTEEVMVKYQLPDGTEISKTSNKRANINLYIGTDKHGNTRIQLGDTFVHLEEIAPYIDHFRQSLADEEKEHITVSLHADKGTAMGVISDVRAELQRVAPITVRYSAQTGQQE